MRAEQRSDRFMQALSDSETCLNLISQKMGECGWDERLNSDTPGCLPLAECFQAQDLIEEPIKSVILQLKRVIKLARYIIDQESPLQGFYAISRLKSFKAEHFKLMNTLFQTYHFEVFVRPYVNPFTRQELAANLPTVSVLHAEKFAHCPQPCFLQEFEEVHQSINQCIAVWKKRNSRCGKEWAQIDLKVLPDIAKYLEWHDLKDTCARINHFWQEAVVQLICPDRMLLATALLKETIADTDFPPRPVLLDELGQLTTKINMPFNKMRLTTLSRLEKEISHFIVRAASDFLLPPCGSPNLARLRVQILAITPTSFTDSRYWTIKKILAAQQRGLSSLSFKPFSHVAAYLDWDDIKSWAETSVFFQHALTSFELSPRLIKGVEVVHEIIKSTGFATSVKSAQYLLINRKMIRNLEADYINIVRYERKLSLFLFSVVCEKNKNFTFSVLVQRRISILSGIEMPLHRAYKKALSQILKRIILVENMTSLCVESRHQNGCLNDDFLDVFAATLTGLKAEDNIVNFMCNFKGFCLDEKQQKRLKSALSQNKNIKLLKPKK
jgi:hypothetical protein